MSKDDLYVPPPTELMEDEGKGKGKGKGKGIMANADKAVIDPRKFTEYALNSNHPVGKHQARVFESALGFNQDNSDDLIGQIKQGVKSNVSTLGKKDVYGERFTVDIPVLGPKGKDVVTTGWIYKSDSNIPELTTILVKKK